MRSLGVLPPSLPAGNAAVRGLLRFWDSPGWRKPERFRSLQAFFFLLFGLCGICRSLFAFSRGGVGGVCGFGFLLLSEAW
jgi:hypothetical protein